MGSEVTLSVAPHFVQVPSDTPSSVQVGGVVDHSNSCLQALLQDTSASVIRIDVTRRMGIANFLKVFILISPFLGFLKDKFCLCISALILQKRKNRVNRNLEKF